MSTNSPAVPGVLANKPGRRFALPKLSELSVPVAVLAIVIALITPMPPLLARPAYRARHHDVRHRDDGHDVHPRPVEFNVFPTALLLLTLFRLALNVCSSRLILLNGNTGTAAAGSVI